MNDVMMENISSSNNTSVFVENISSSDTTSACACTSSSLVFFHQMLSKALEISCVTAEGKIIPLLFPNFVFFVGVSMVLSICFLFISFFCFTLFRVVCTEQASGTKHTLTRNCGKLGGYKRKSQTSGLKNKNSIRSGSWNLDPTFKLKYIHTTTAPSFHQLYHNDNILSKLYSINTIIGAIYFMCVIHI